MAAQREQARRLFGDLVTNSDRELLTMLNALLFRHKEAQSKGGWKLGVPKHALVPTNLPLSSLPRYVNDAEQVAATAGCKHFVSISFLSNRCYLGTQRTLPVRVIRAIAAGPRQTL